MQTHEMNEPVVKQEGAGQPIAEPTQQANVQERPRNSGSALSSEPIGNLDKDASTETEAKSTNNEADQSNQEDEKPAQIRKNFVPQARLNQYAYKLRIANDTIKNFNSKLETVEKQNEELKNLIYQLNPQAFQQNTEQPMTMSEYVRLRDEERKAQQEDAQLDARIDEATDWLGTASKELEAQGVKFPQSLEEDIAEIIMAQGWDKEDPITAVKKAFDIYIADNVQDVPEEQTEGAEPSVVQEEKPKEAVQVTKTPEQVRQEQKTKAAGSVRAKKASADEPGVVTKSMSLKDMEKVLFPGDGSNVGQLFNR